MNSQRIPNQRAIADRRKLTAGIATLFEEQGEKSRADIVALLREALENGRANGLGTALDFDFRPNLWGVAGIGVGVSGFV